MQEVVPADYSSHPFLAVETPSESYYRARYYDPTTGRFLSEDPIGFTGGDINVYRYSFSDPVNLEDPTGLTVSCGYNQSTGRLRCTDDLTGNEVVNTVGYSGGNRGKCPSCVNNPRVQSLPFDGPIPTGNWTISRCFTWYNSQGRPMPETMRLTPRVSDDTSLDAFLRSPGFLIHGGRQNGAKTASEGCIIIEPSARHAICQAGGGNLHVVSGLPPATPLSLWPSYPPPGIRSSTF